MFNGISRFFNRKLISILGYDNYYLLKTIYLRIRYKNSVIALSIDGGNFKIPIGEGQRIIVWSIVEGKKSFRCASDDFESQSENRSILRVNKEIVYGEKIGKTRLLVRSSSHPLLETSCEVEVI